MLRRTLVFLFFGASLFGLETWLSSKNARRPKILSVEIADSKSKDHVIREAILFDFAYRKGWHETDPVIYQHTVRNMRFVEEGSEQPEGKLFQVAKGLGLLKEDPVVRARLIALARTNLTRIEASQRPTKVQLQDYLNSHAKSFKRLESIKFAHVFLNKERRAQTLKEDASNIYLRIKKDEMTPEEAFRLGDPLMRARALEMRNIGELERVYGSTVAENLKAVSMDKWLPPVYSHLGAHIFKVTTRTPARPARLDEVRNQVLGAVLNNIESENFERRYANLKQQYAIQLEATDE